MAAGRNISYVKPSEPSFIRRMKTQVGYKAGPTVDTKREQLPRDDDGDDDDDGCIRDDEKPQVVVLGPGDLTQEEAHEILDEAESQSNDKRDDHSDNPATGKISFRKPGKRSNATGGADYGNGDSRLNATSKRCRRTSNGDDDQHHKKTSSMQQVNNPSLLSFAEEYDDNDNDE